MSSQPDKDMGMQQNGYATSSQPANQPTSELVEQQDVYASASQPTNQQTSKLEYTLQIADTVLIHAQRLSEWCGHGPILEQDIALTNTSLDHIGATRSLYQHAAELFNALPAGVQESMFTSPALDARRVAAGAEGITEDDLSFLRDAWDFRNVLLSEQPNEDWAYTIARCFFIDTFNYYFYSALRNSSDSALAAVAEKSLKEVTYHLKWSSEWVIRLGDGTDESAARMQKAVNDRWAYTGELFTPSESDTAAVAGGYGVDLAAIQPDWDAHVARIFSEAGLTAPKIGWMQRGGKQGTHSEHLGYILAEMQYMQRTYPGMDW